MEQLTDSWRTARLGKVTASKVKDVMANGRGGAPSATRTNYMMQLLCERLTGTWEEGYTNAAMARGTEKEPTARLCYELVQDCEVQEVGLIQHPKIKGMAASPDGIIVLPLGRGGLEIKCPNTAQHIAVMRSGKHDTKYEWQMLAQMACAELEWVDFVSFDDRLPEELQYVCYRYHRDEKRIREMEAGVQEFLAELAELEADMRKRMQA